MTNDELKKEVNDTANFNLNPPVELNKYDESIRQFCAAYESIFTMTYSFLSSMIKDDAEVLVVGAGTGMEICTFSSKSPKWQYTGVDPSSEMLSITMKQRMGFWIRFYSCIKCSLSTIGHDCAFPCSI